MSILRRATDFILQSRLQAMGVAFVCAYIPYIGSLSVVIAAFVTLRKNAKEGALVFLAATLPSLLTYFATRIDPNDLSLAMIALSVTIASNVIIWLCAILLKRYENWGLLLDFTILLGIVFIVLIHMMYPDIQNFWSARLTEYFSKISINSSDSLTPENQAQIIAVLSRYAGGLMAASILLNAVLQVVIARWWQGVMYNPGGLREELYNIRLSHVVGVLYVICFAFSYMNYAIAVDIMPILYIMFSLAGLSLMHYILGPRKNSWLWLLMAYVLIIMSIQKSVMLISIVAFLDIWLNFRSRFTRPNNI
jgi:hypothetical protein